MTVFASSNFNGTEGDNLSTFDANWKKQSGATGDAEIASSRARQSSTTTTHYYYDAAAASADYTVSADLFNPGEITTSIAGVTGRAASGASTFYQARYEAANTAVRLIKSVAGSFTQLGSVSRTSFPASDTRPIVLSMSGSNLEVTWNNEGTPLISVTDTGITAAGFPGIRFNTTNTPTDTAGIQLDNFSADEAGGGASQTVAFTLEDVSAAVSQNLSHAQSLTGTLDDVTVSISQTVQHSQALDAALDGVTVAASQTLSHSQALAATLDGITVAISQSAAPSSKEQSLAVVLDGIQVAIAQEGPANLIDTHDGFWAKEWARIRAREKRKHNEEIQERVEEIQDEIAEVEQQIVEVKQAPKPKKSTPVRNFYAEQARIVEHLIARRNQLIDEEDEELLLLL